MDVTEQAESGSFDLDVYDNGTLTVRVIDRQDGYHDGTAKIMCFDRTAPTVTAGISGEPLHVEAKDDLSGVAGIQVNRAAVHHAGRRQAGYPFQRGGNAEKL